MFPSLKIMGCGMLVCKRDTTPAILRQTNIQATRISGFFSFQIIFKVILDITIYTLFKQTVCGFINGHM